MKIQLVLMLLGAFPVFLRADDRSVDQVRFFPAKGAEQAMVGGKFAGSNVSELAGYETLATIDAAPPAGKWTEMKLPTTKGYRWYRYEGPPGSYGQIAEIEFLSDGKVVNSQSTCFGSIGNHGPMHAWIAAVDGKTETSFYSSMPDGQFVGFDFGGRADAPPTFETPPGTVPNSAQITLKAGDGATIRYAIGGAPTSDTGTVYSGPITLDHSATIFAAAYRPGRAPSPTVSATYLVGAKAKAGQSSLTIGNSLSGISLKIPDFFATAGWIHSSHGMSVAGSNSPAIYKNFILQPDRKNKGTSWNELMSQFHSLDDCIIQVFNMSPADESDTDIKIFDLMRAKYSDLQPWLYDIWEEMYKTPPHEVVMGQIPSLQMKTLHPSETWEEKDAAWTVYNEDIRTRMLQTYQGAKKPKIIPCSLAVAWLKNMLDHGKIPGLTSADFPFIMFHDNFHPGPIGRYLVAMTWYAALYGDSPVGKIAPIDTDLTPEQAGILQNLAWDTVQNYPYAGIYQTGTTPAEAPQFSPAPSGSIAGPTQITLSSATPGAWFRYTLDGTPPSHTTGYAYCGVITVRPGMTVKAVAFKNGTADSSVSEATYPGP